MPPHNCNYGDLIPRMDEKLDRLLTSSDKRDEVLFGNGSDNLGLVKEVDRLKTFKHVTLWIGGTVLTISGFVAGEFFIKWLERVWK